MAEKTSQVAVMLSEKVSARIDHLCTLKDSPFDEKALRDRLRGVAAGPANTAAEAELDRMEKLLNPEPTPR